MMNRVELQNISDQAKIEKTIPIAAVISQNSSIIRGVPADW
jgi:hypothetical protein